MSSEVLTERVFFPGPAGRLAGELAYPVKASPRRACLLVNPHPYMGGRMGNNVVTRLAAGLPEADTITLRFDYAGVGESERDPARPVDVARSMSEFWATGRAPEDPGWIEDARAALCWLHEQAPAPLVLIGYSFGAHVAATILDDRVRELVLVSPTPARHDLSSVRTRTCPKLIIYSDNDFATPAEVTERWVAGLPEPKRAVRISGAEHFFRGAEPRLIAVTRDFLARRYRAEEVAA